MDKNDGIELIDSETGEVMIFNFKTWLEIIKGIIIQYTDKTAEEATYLLNERNFAVPETYNQGVYYSHEIEYHWAMLVVYNDGYWLKGISSDQPKGYDDWEDEYRRIHSLKEESIEFCN